MGSTTPFLIAAVFIYYAHSLPTISDNPINIKGYSYLGVGSTNGSTQRRAGIRYVMAQNALSQKLADDACHNIGGELLSILNPIQDADIKRLTSGASENDHIWTSGVFDKNNQQWTWNSNGLIMIYTNFRNPAANPNPSVGVTISGTLSTYGWSAIISNECYYKYICQF